MLPGVDLANWQGPPSDWRPQAGAISCAAVKFSQYDPDGTRSVNEDAAADWADLKARSKGRIAYLYGRPSSSVTGTVALFASVARDLGLEDGDGIAVDIEVNDGLSPPRVAAWMADLTGLLAREFGRKILCYSFLSFIWAGNLAGCGHLPLWLADPSAPAGHPTVPLPWTTFAIHQWAITGPIDRDLANFGSLDAMRAALGKTTAPDPRTKREDDVPSGILLQPGPTPIRAEQRNLEPYSQLLLSGCKGMQQADLTVSVLDADGSYDVHASVTWEHPAVVSFRHPRRTRAVSVERTDKGADAVAWLLT